MAVVRARWKNGPDQRHPNDTETAHHPHTQTCAQVSNLLPSQTDDSEQHQK